MRTYKGAGYPLNYEGIISSIIPKAKIRSKRYKMDGFNFLKITDSLLCFWSCRQIRITRML